MMRLKVLGVSSTECRVTHHGAGIANRATGQPRHNHPLLGCTANDRAVPRNALPARCSRGVSEASTAKRLNSQKRSSRLHAERGDSLDLAACSKTQHQAPRVVVQLDQCLLEDYGSPVAVSPATDLGRSSINRRTSAKQHTGAFLLPAFYGSCARDTFGCAGFLFARSANPRTAATIPRLAANGGSSQIGATPMQHALNPSRLRAAAHRRMAFAALRTHSSAAVRLSRYQHHMAKARALEAEGGVK